VLFPILLLSFKILTLLRANVPFSSKLVCSNVPKMVLRNSFPYLTAPSIKFLSQGIFFFF
jgi:hypothetical protein